jgi:hypothetical protein
MPVATISGYETEVAKLLRPAYAPIPMTSRDGENAKRLLGTIFAIHVGNAEDGQADKCSLHDLHSTHPCVSKTSKMGGLFVASCLSSEEIGTVKTANKYLRLFQSQTLDNFLPGSFFGRGSQGLRGMLGNCSCNRESCK